jgi:hypothetical protein
MSNSRDGKTGGPDNQYGPDNPYGDDEYADEYRDGNRKKKKIDGRLQSQSYKQAYPAPASAAAAAEYIPAASAASATEEDTAYNYETKRGSKRTSSGEIKKEDIATLTEFGEKLDALVVPNNDAKIREKLDNLIRDISVIREDAKQKLLEQIAAKKEADKVEEQKILDKARDKLQAAFKNLNYSGYTTSQQLAVLQQATTLIFALNSQNSPSADVDAETAPIQRMLSELPRIMYNECLALLTGVLVSIKDITPIMAKQIVSCLAGVGLIFQYLPVSIQNDLITVPYIGNFFQILNFGGVSSSVLLANAIPSISAMFYYLRNSGFEIASARNVLNGIAASAMPIMKYGVAKIKEESDIIANTLTSAAGGVAESMIDKLATYLTSDYLKAEPFTFQSDGSSISSASSASSVSTSSSKASIKSAQAIDSSIDLIRSEPVNDPYDPTFEEDIVKAIADEKTDDSVLSLVEVIDEEPPSQGRIIVDDPNQNTSDSQVSAISNGYGGSKRLSYLKSKKSKKNGRKGKITKRKGKITKKRRKGRKTLKKRK